MYPLNVQTDGLPLVKVMAPGEFDEMSNTNVPLDTKGLMKLLNVMTGTALTIFNDASIVPLAKVLNANCVARILMAPPDKMVTLFPFTVAIDVLLDVYLNAPDELEFGAESVKTELATKFCDKMENSDKVGFVKTVPKDLIDKVVVAVPEV